MATFLFDFLFLRLGLRAWRLPGYFSRHRRGGPWGPLRGGPLGDLFVGAPRGVLGKQKVYFVSEGAKGGEKNMPGEKGAGVLS